jgi:hypothetical protein
MTMSNDRGVFCISRKLFDSGDPFFGGEPFTRREAWQWLIAEAAWKPRRIRVSTGRGDTFIELDRGQLSHSRSYMQKAWNWSSDKRVRTFLDRLEMDSRIGRTKGQASGQTQCIITVCKYDEYQFPFEAEGHASGHPSGQASGHPKATQGPETKKYNKSKKRTGAENGADPSQFEQWYSSYPKKVDRKDAEKCFNRLMSAGEVSFGGLMAATARYAAAMVGVEPKYIKAPAVWINKGSYLDEASPTSNVAGPAIEGPTRDPRTFSDDEWRSYLKCWDEKREWSTSYWGAKPGHPGCLVPAHLILNPVSTSSGAA